MKNASGKISLILGSHAHVPYGARESEFGEVYSGLLRPFVLALHGHPGIQATLHYSGVLLHWMECNHGEILSMIGEMVNRKQVEVLGGGFYGPVLPPIPQQDKIGQVELLTTYIRKKFGRRPQGCWIPEYEWEQALVSPLASCGMGFTFLDERQFSLAGADPFRPCICEDQGKLLTVFPVSGSAEAALAGKGISRLLEDYARAVGARGEAGEAVLSIFPGREASPVTSWERFFEELSLCDFVQTVSPGKLLKRLKGLSRAYIPDSSSDAASVPSRRSVATLPEAGRLYSRMVFTNTLVNQLRGDKTRKTSAHEELWKAQGGCLFRVCGRHGPHDLSLRGAAYAAMLGAERISREAGAFSPSLLPFDFDMDGEEEWLFQEPALNCYVRPTGGGIFELDYMPGEWNYLATCGDRIAFADRLLPAGTDAENIETGGVPGARLCHGERYGLVDADRVRRTLLLSLPKAEDGPFASIEIKKGFSIKKDTVIVGYSITNSGTETESFILAPEIDLALPGETSAYARFHACKSGKPDEAFSGVARGTDCVKIDDIKNETRITLSANVPFDVRIVPVYLADGGPGGGFFQAFCIMPLLQATVEPGKSWDARFELRFSH